MVGIVLVSHSRELAKATAALGRQMAPDARVVAVGGLEDGGFGTSYERIEAAIEQVLGDDGVILIMDMGSSVMTARMVIWVGTLLDNGFRWLLLKILYHRKMRKIT